MKFQKAFTLVELSIVIVIIGLIVAGVTAGKSLVNQAKLRSIMTDFAKYRAAVNSFYLQYNALPGDMRNASSYWSGALDGDGNNKIDNNTGNEDLKAWQHMALAGIIPGVYSGVTTGVGRVPGANSPASSYANAGFGFDLFTVYGKIANAITFGGASVGTIGGPIIPPNEAFAIDTKMDDGVANKGTVITLRGGASLCVDQPYSVPATTAVNYTLTDFTPSCRIWYYLDKK